MPYRPEEVRFGNGRVIGTVLLHPDYDSWSEREQAERMAKAVGCPVMNKVIAERTDGPARDRYLQVGFWFGQMVHSAERVNKHLAEQLKEEVPRRQNEPVGIHEPESVPGYYDRLIPPTETLTGFAVPRLLIGLHDSPALSAEDPETRFMTVWGMLEDAAGRSRTPSALLAHCAQGAVNLGMNKDRVLQHALPNGWYLEHNANYMATEGMIALAQYAPDVWGTYKEHTQQEIDRMGII